MKHKALVIEDNPHTLAEIDDTLTALGHEYESVSCLRDARTRLKANGYSYILLNNSIPARPGGKPRIQNTENFLDLLANTKGDKMPPVIVILPPESAYTNITHEASVRWASGVVRRGATDFIAIPFEQGGRTLDRVIKKVLKTGKPERVHVVWDEPDEDNTVDDAIKPKKSSHPPTTKSESSLPKDAKKSWPGIPNDPITLVDFMATHCEQRSKKNRIGRKNALLAAARHKTVNLPPLAMPRKQGQANMFFVHDLLSAWQGFIDESVNIPPLQPINNTNNPSTCA